MLIERWGSLSVSDHVNTSALVANVLLYDRLVVPVMVDQPDRDERAYWCAHGWDPDLQERRLDQLGPLAIRRPWNTQRREQYRTRAMQLAAEQADAKHIDALGLTRRLLAQEQVVELPAGVAHVEVIGAYNSTRGVRHDYRLTDRQDHLSSQALLITRRLALPAGADREHALSTAIKLSQEPEFRSKRAELFEWQATTLTNGYPPEVAVERLAELSAEYNGLVKAASGKVRWKLAFTLCGIGLGFATGGVLAGGAAAALSLVQFALLDREPAVEPGTSRPAAMFHDIRSRVGAELTAKPDIHS
jgi:hypothetical protein